jgi:aryl-alcohol dehydrogenase-like predicted oxidoreductase
MGTRQTFDVGPGERLRQGVTDVLRAYRDAGGRVVDLSPMYGRSEEAFSDVAACLSMLSDLFIATKVWTTGRAEGIAQMEQSIRLVGGRVDLMQVLNLLDVDVHLATLREWKAGERDAEKRLLPAAAANGVAFIANRPFGEGKLIKAVAKLPRRLRRA